MVYREQRQDGDKNEIESVFLAKSQSTKLCFEMALEVQGTDTFRHAPLGF